MIQPNIRLANFLLLAEYQDEYPAGWYLVHILIHVGTNNLSDESMTSDTIVDDILQLANKMEERGIKCIISELITRRDENDEKVRLVNKKLEERKIRQTLG